MWLNHLQNDGRQKICDLSSVEFNHWLVGTSEITLYIYIYNNVANTEKTNIGKVKPRWTAFSLDYIVFMVYGSLGRPHLCELITLTLLILSHFCLLAQTTIILILWTPTRKSGDTNRNQKWSYFFQASKSSHSLATKSFLSALFRTCEQIARRQTMTRHKQNVQIMGRHVKRLLQLRWPILTSDTPDVPRLCSSDVSFKFEQCYGDKVSDIREAFDNSGRRETRPRSHKEGRYGLWHSTPSP